MGGGGGVELAVIASANAHGSSELRNCEKVEVAVMRGGGRGVSRTVVNQRLQTEWSDSSWVVFSPGEFRSPIQSRRLAPDVAR